MQERAYDFFRVVFLPRMRLMSQERRVEAQGKLMIY